MSLCGVYASALKILGRGVVKMVKFGVIADLHGEEHLKQIVAALKDADVAGVILNGDMVPRSGSGIEQVLLEAKKIDKPLYIIPGSHEKKVEYSEVMDRLTQEYSVFIDMLKNRKVEAAGMKFVSLPGSYSRNAETAEEEMFALSPADFEKLKELIDEPDKTILVTHDPPLGINDLAKIEVKDGMLRPAWNGPTGWGEYKEVKNGIKELTDVIYEKGVRFGVTGHIHEAGFPNGTQGVTINLNEIAEINAEKQVSPDDPKFVAIQSYLLNSYNNRFNRVKYSIPAKVGSGIPARTMFLNPGPAELGFYGILEIQNNGETASYESKRVTKE